MTAKPMICRDAALAQTASRPYIESNPEVLLSDPELPEMNAPETNKVTPLNRVNEKAAIEAQAVLEQMYGYFSFEPMPLEAEERLAA